METTRQQKVSRLLQKELGSYFQQHAMEILPGKMITVTVVRVSPDLGLAKAYLSIFPADKDADPLSEIKKHDSSIIVL